MATVTFGRVLVSCEVREHVPYILVIVGYPRTQELVRPPYDSGLVINYAYPELTNSVLLCSRVTVYPLLLGNSTETRDNEVLP